MPGGVDVPERVGVRVEVAVKTRRVALFAEVGVLGGESADFGVVEAGFGVVESRLLVPEVAGEN
jgi:hypothetical protein